MLPRSCLRLADSKSNSSTRWPRSTATRVSSGWVASISILLGIDQSLARRRARGRSSLRTARSDTGLTVVKGAGPWNTADLCLRRGSVAARRNFRLAGIDLDVRSQHDLLARNGAATLRAPPRVLG